MTSRDDDSTERGEPGESERAERADRRAGPTERSGGSGESIRSDRPRGSGQSGQSRRSSPPPRRGGSTGTDDESELVYFLRDIAVSILAVALLGGYIFMISGVWPPMVAIESGSMEPNMDVNDLVFVMETDRFQPAAAHGETGVVTAAEGRTVGYEQFGKSGDVIVFNPQGNEEVTPIIHRAMLYVEDGENWYDRANPTYIGSADNCQELLGCPASNAGFITKGDDNPTYDQTGNGQLDPVRAEWVVGTAEYRVPGLGWFRLRF
jgi:signal peptidase